MTFKLAISWMAMLLSATLWANDLDSSVRKIARSENHRLAQVVEEKVHPVEDSLYKTKSWKTYTFVAKNPLKESGPEKYFFKYAVSILSFDDSIKAQRRLDSVNAYYLPEDIAVKHTQFGLRVANQVIFLTTSPTIYRPSLKALYKDYCRQLGLPVRMVWSTTVLDELVPIFRRLGFDTLESEKRIKRTESEAKEFGIDGIKSILMKSSFAAPKS